MSLMEERMVPCDICAQPKIDTKIVRCKNDHVFCTRCLKQIGRLGNSRCPYANCKRKLIRKLPTASGDAKKMFRTTQADIAEPVVDIRQSCSTLYNPDKMLSLSISRRPVYCPHQNCNWTVAVSSLSSHFLYEHRNIQKCKITFEQRTRVNCSLINLTRNTRHTLLYLELVEEDEDARRNNKHKKSKVLSTLSQRPIVFVMVYKFPLVSENEVVQVFNDSDDSEPDELIPMDPQEVDTDGEDKIMIWLGANIATPFAYTVAASTSCEKVRLKYYGPLGTIHEEPNNLYEQGLGLVFTQGSHRKMVARSKSGAHIALDLMIHPERDDVFCDIDSG